MTEQLFKALVAAVLFGTVGWAGSYPPVRVGLYSDNRVGRANVQRVQDSRSCKNAARDFFRVHSAGVLQLVDMARVYDRRDCSPEIGLSSTNRLRSAKKSFAGTVDVNLLNVKLWPTSLKCGQNEPEGVVGSSLHVGIEAAEVPFVFLVEILQDGIPKAFGFFLEGPRRAQDQASGGPSIETVPFIPSRAIHCEKDSVGVVNLAYQLSSRSSATDTVGAEQDVVVKTKDDDSGAEDTGRAEQDQSPKSFRYIRYRVATRSGMRSQSGQFFEDAYQDDYDASQDGEHWFHLIGEECRSGYQKLIVLAPPEKK